MHHRYLSTIARSATTFLAAASCVALAADLPPAAASADPFVGKYLGTFEPQGWSAGFGHKARFDKPEEVDAMERAGIDPRTLKPEEAFAAYEAAARSADAAKTMPGEGNYNTPASAAATKPHRCAACHTEATVERAESGYQLSFAINHGKDKEGKTIIVRRTIPGTQAGPDQLVFSNEKYHVELKSGQLSGRFTGLMISKIGLQQSPPDDTAAAKK